MNKDKLLQITTYFDELFPDVKGELLYNHDYELLIAVILSAQATDKSVNAVTRTFFVKYPSIESINRLSLSELEDAFKSIGLYQAKSANIKKTISILLNQYDGKVPSDKEILLSLPGVGIKTANVIRAELFKIPEIAVDTHVHRIAKRLGFAKPNDSLAVVEEKLKRSLAKERYIKTHHQMIHFGRYFCKAKKPNCGQCKLVSICLEKNKNL